MSQSRAISGLFTPYLRECDKNIDKMEAQVEGKKKNEKLFVFNFSQQIKIVNLEIVKAFTINCSRFYPLLIAKVITIKQIIASSSESVFNCGVEKK